MSAISLDLDDDFALCATGLDIGQSLVGGLERKNLVKDGTDRSFVDEASERVRSIKVGQRIKR